MPLVYVSAAFLAGVFAASQYNIPVWSQLAVPIAASLLLISSRFLPATRLPALALLAFTAGIWRYDLAAPRGEDGALLSAVREKRTVQVRGIVDAPPEMRELRQNIRLTAKEVRVDDTWQVASETLLIFAGLAPAFEYGDYLEVAGKVEEPPEFEGFNYRDYLSSQGIYHVMQRPQIRLLDHNRGLQPVAWLSRLRTRLSDSLSAALPEPEASVAEGILLGSRSSMPGALVDAFAATGTTHILAVSGYNITVVAGALIALAGRIFGRNRATYVTIAGIGFYALLAGASPSVLRAAVMGALVVVAYRVGRQSHIVNALALSCALLVALQPQWLWDIGFQLSFLATMGLVFVSRPLSALLLRGVDSLGIFAKPVLKQIVAFIGDGLAITLAATIYTLPLTAYNFHNLSLISPVANLFAVPALPPIMGGAAAVASAGIFSPALAQVAAYLAWPFTAYLVRVVELFARIPGASVAAPSIGVYFVWIYYAVLAGLSVSLHLRRDGLAEVWTKLQEYVQPLGDAVFRLVNPLPGKWIVPPMALFMAVIWAVLLSQPDDRLHVTFLDVGQGDAILVRLPNNRKVLVDGGPSPQRLLNRLGEKMPFWDRSLDVVILTHSDEDHLAGLLGLLDSYQVRLVLEGPANRPTALYDTWENELTKKGVRHEYLQPGQQLRAGKVDIDIIYVPRSFSGGSEETRNQSVVLRLKMADVSFLLPGDMPAEIQPSLLRLDEDLRSTVLKIPHHGARDALEGRFLEAVSPQVAVISVGVDNPFGHPASETTALLSAVPTFRTDLSGSIEIVTDGKMLWVDKQR